MVGGPRPYSPRRRYRPAGARLQPTSPGDRPHRRRGLHRLRHPRLPRPARACGPRTRRPSSSATSTPTWTTPRSGASPGRRAATNPVLAAVPNAGAPGPGRRWSGRGKLVALLTQNIDELHQKAGSSPERCSSCTAPCTTPSAWPAARERDDGRGARPRAVPARTTRAAWSAAGSSSPRRSCSASRSTSTSSRGRARRPWAATCSSPSAPRSASTRPPGSSTSPRWSAPR